MNGFPSSLTTVVLFTSHHKLVYICVEEEEGSSTVNFITFAMLLSIDPEL